MKYLISLFLIFSFLTSYDQTSGIIKQKISLENIQLLKTGSHPVEEKYLNIYKLADSILLSDKNSNFLNLTKNIDFINLCKKNNITHTGGPMLGNISENGANIWIRTLYPSEVIVKIIDKNKTLEFGPVLTNEFTDLTAIVKINGLESGKKYPYKIFINNKEINTSTNCYINTLKTNADTTRIIFGSCFHRWGLANYEEFKTIISRKPNAALFLGDIAVQDRNNNLGKHRSDYLARDFYTGWKELTVTIPVYATWDDHDYFNNDKWGIPPGYSKTDKENVWNVFRYAWNNPYYGLSDSTKGTFFRTKIQSCDIIMLDERYFRTGEKGLFLGNEQMKWLEEQLLDCKEPFIILSCGTMWSDYVSNGKDSWGVFDPEGREKIFQLIEKNNIKGVLLISGDRHGARIFTIPRDNNFKLYEFEIASLGGRIGPPATDTSWTNQLYGISDKYAFGEFTINTKRVDPSVTFRLISDTGIILYELTLLQSELTYRKEK